MSWKSPAFTQPSFKSSLLERSLARMKCYAVVRSTGSSPHLRGRSAILAGAPHLVGSLSPLAGAAARKQADDLLVVVRRVDDVRSAGRGHDVEQLGPALEHLARAGVPSQREEIAPQPARQDHGRRPAL